MVFASIWDSIDAPFPMERLNQLDKASTTQNSFYNNTYVLFSVKRFPDALRAFSARYENVHLVEFKALMGAESFYLWK